ncbi:MAG: UDP-N-acetylmuramoyl-L-alanine--D-glutamate ligase, partial [Candidatus Omnitrophica bacterium]|nr:UDP-N-acetylmuramoyl-L-alanine--D-glutamate ligase [Candidatus Omnitrophota bacterium]
MMNLKGKHVTVVGLGISGLSAAKLLLKAGARVSVTDNGNGDNLHKNKELLDGMGVNVEIGTHTEGFIKGSEMLIVSPGVDTNSLPILWAEKEGIPIIGEIELAFSFCKAPIIAITGSNGKTTVTTLTGELLKAGGIKSYVCGNIGLPFCDVAMDADAGDVVVLEVSSFQLTRTINFKPKVSVILNVTENHLDKHGNLQEYIDSKLRIFKNQSAGDKTILNYDDPNLKSVEATSDVLYFSRFKEVRGAFADKDAVFLNVDGTKVKICTKGEVSMKGEHNIENIMAAVLLASCFNINPDVMRKVVTNFKGLPHRFEYAGSK